MNKMRRTLCQSLGGLFGLIGLNACSQPRPKQIERVYTEEEKQRLYKFRGVEGGQWVLSSVHELRWIEIRNQDDRVIDAPAGVSPGSRSRFSLSSIPIRLKVIWREQDPNNPIYSGKRGEEWSGGKIIASFEIPVADRIPDALLDDLRRDPRGGLRIKIRLHREGVLLGWDIERRPGYDPKKRDSWGSPVYVGAVHSFFGGDFREADIFNGKVVRKGWYIHPKTGQRIETDF
jgi:hypothetical protein